MSISEVLYSSRSEEWGTPQVLFDELDAEFHFDVDVCATDKNAKCSKFFTKEQDGLKQSWSGKTVWCNPPYGKKIAEWVKKAYLESRGGGGCIVLLLPARTDTRYFHDYIYHKADVRFIRGRLRFTDEYGKAQNSAPFPSMIVIYNGPTERRKNQ